MAAQTGPKRTHAQREADLAETAQLRNIDWSARKIAEYLSPKYPGGLSEQTIQSDFAELDMRQQQRMGNDLDLHRALMLTQLDQIIRQSYIGWERSLSDAERTELSSGNDANGPWDTSKVVRAAQCGDPRFSKVMLDALDRRAKLLGLDAPTKTEVKAENFTFTLPDSWGKSNPPPVESE